MASHFDFQPPSHGDLVHLTPRAPPIEGDPGVLQDYQYFRLKLDFPEIKTQAGVSLLDRDEGSYSLGQG
jgi:hypothetical protein